MLTPILTLFMFVVSCSAWAETAKPAYVPPVPAVATENLMQMMGGLVLVLAIIAGLTWFAKRFALIPTTASGSLKVIAATGVGQRERVVVVEIEKTWLVLGVAPGQVNKLHVMEKPLFQEMGILQGDKPNEEFAARLDQSIKKEHAE